MPLVNQITVHFIRADNHPFTQADLRYVRQLILMVNTPHRVMWVAQDEHLCLFSYGSLERLPVDLVVNIFPVGQFGILALHPSIFWGGEEGRVDRRLYQ